MARSTALAPAPTGEVGAPANIASAFPGVPNWGSMMTMDEMEQAPELQWPNSILTYQTMWNDSQVEGLLAGTVLPIRRYRWMIHPNGCKMADVEKLAGDLNLPIKGKDSDSRKRAKGRFSHDKHMFHAFKALGYGHYFMEQVAEIGTDGIAHLRKLAPRPPHTLQSINVERDGGLKSIQQNVNGQRQTNFGQAPEIPASKLVAYTWDQEGANWLGRSMFRAIYKNWLIKDRLLRVDALKHERNGMGVPVAFGAPGMGPTDLARLNALAQSYKAGEGAGAAFPNGSDLKLLGVQGSLPDTIASIRFHNEEMARRFLMMFMQLGESSHGNRALGESFIDFFAVNQDTTARWYADITSEHVIEDWWDWNIDPEADETPYLTWERSDDPRDAFGPFAQLVQTGAIQVDDELEEAIREAMALPPRSTPRVQITVPGSTDPAGSGSGVSDNNPNEQASPDSSIETAKARGRAGRDVKGAISPVPVPARPLRRQPNEVEASAAMDFATMDINWQLALDKLFNDYRGQVVTAQIEELHSLVNKHANNLEALAALEAPALGADVIETAMKAMFDEGVRQAQEEAASQGHVIAAPAAEDHANFLERARAVDEVNARTLGAMAGTRAMRLSGGKLTKAEVAQQTREYLDGLAFAMLRDRLGGALTAAQNVGRRAVMSEGPAARYYSSELLDQNCCAPCSMIDGTEYTNLSDSERDYPAGGYVSCSGGDRCRGTVVAVYKEDNV
jgi:hypothetical protein